MSITPQLIEELAKVAMQFTHGAVWVVPEAVAALSDEYGDDGVFEVRVELGTPPRFHLDHRSPDGTLTSLFTVEGVTGAQLEEEARKQGKSAAIH